MFKCKKCLALQKQVDDLTVKLDDTKKKLDDAFANKENLIQLGRVINDVVGAGVGVIRLERLDPKELYSWNAT